MVGAGQFEAIEERAEDCRLLCRILTVEALDQSGVDRSGAFSRYSYTVTFGNGRCGSVDQVD
jgi:hypothetical protein